MPQKEAAIKTNLHNLSFLGNLVFMEITLKSRNKGDKKVLQILKYKKIAEPRSTLLVLHEEMTGDNNARWSTYDMFKVQFIASCTTEECGQILCAFYFANEGSILCIQPLDYHVKGYDPEKNYSLIDYKSYLEICDLTKETPLPFAEYVQISIENSTVINSLVEEKGKYMRSDELPHL